MSIEEVKPTYFSEYYAKHRDLRKAQTREYYITHREAILAREKRRYLKKKDSILARTKLYAKAHADQIREKKKQYVEEHREELNEKKRQRVAWLKSEAYRILGNICCKCGFKDIRAIQVDHINGGGGRDLKNHGLHGIYREIVFNTEEAKKKYQLLCANCNVIKAVEKGERPHRREAA